MIEKKIKTKKALSKLIKDIKRKGKKVGFTNGCFDILHLGHVKYLEGAKKLCDILIVGINSDSSVRKIKGNSRPVINQDDRLSIIAALESVDYVTLFSENTPLSLIRALGPDIIIKGADWKHKDIVGRDFVESYGGEAVTIPCIKNRSTTEILNKIGKRF